ncbi:hypothetical protein HYV22_02290 [Candidatus Gottesmanbacteria bacterium]|nr:hypothetical protein [Candidatus Gottesmanbacteria bacterium]
MGKQTRRLKAISWLPIDSRLFTPFLSFGRVRGIARVFLQVEIILSLLVVIGVFVMVLMKFVS